jgi:hypothetical protein
MKNAGSGTSKENDAAPCGSSSAKRVELKDN